MLEKVTTKVEGVFVKSCSSVNVVVKGDDLPRPFRVDSVRIPDEVARHFFVTDVKVGRNSQLLSVGAVPATVFSESSRVQQPELDDLREGQGLTLSVTCTSEEDQVFSAMVSGHQVTSADALVRSRRRMVLGLGSTSVPPGQRANISVQPQCPFRPDGLVVFADVAGHFRVVDLKVGKNSQSNLFDGLEGSGLMSVSAQHFTEVSERPAVRMDQAQVSMFVTVTVENVSDSPQNFQGAVVGECYYYWEDTLGDTVSVWTLVERSLVATRLLAVVHDDLSAGRYGRDGRPTVVDVVQVLNAPAEVLDARREYFASIMSGKLPGAAETPKSRALGDEDDVFDS